MTEEDDNVVLNVEEISGREICLSSSTGYKSLKFLLDPLDKCCTFYTEPNMEGQKADVCEKQGENISPGDGMMFETVDLFG